MANGTKAKIYKADEVHKIRYKLPKSLMRAAGLMRRKHKALEKHLAQVRKEWDRKR